MSNINPQNIDGTFPIAGQDNNSQGFRDNFTNTINNFTSAAAELTDLQTYAVVTSALTSVGQSGTPTNNMNYTFITKPQLKGAVETSATNTPDSGGAFTVDWSTGHFQTVTLTQNSTMSFASTWPTTNLWTRLRLQVTVTGGTWTLTLPTTVSVNSENIQGSNGASPAVITLATGTYIFEFSTSNNGSAVTIQDVLRNYTGSSTVSGNLTITGNTVRAGGTIDSGYQYYAIAGNTAISANVNVSRVIVDPTSSGYGVVLTLPAGNVDAKTFTFSSTNNIAGLQSIGNTGTTVVPSANVALTAGSSVTYFYHAVEGKWYRF